MKLMQLFAIVLLVSGFPPVLAQDTRASRPPVSLDLDFARFYGSEEQLYVEMYYGVREDQLTYLPDSAGYRGGFRMSVEVWSDTGREMVRKWTVSHRIPDPSPRGQTLVGVQPFGLLPGNYSLRVVASDVHNPARRDSVALPVPVALIQPGRMSLSDIELCTEIRDSAVNRDSPFYKNTKEVQPNPSMLYGMGLPILYYYAEVYNLKSDSRSTDLFLTSAVIDAAGHEVLHKTKKKPRTFDSSIEVGTMNLSTLSEGTYILRLTLADSLRKPFAQSSRKFFVYNPRNRVRDTSAVKAPSAMGAFEFMTEAELDREFRYIRYIATDRDRSQYEQLTGVDAKRSFLFTFWTARDIDRTTERNEYRDEYLQRVRFAQESYTVGPHEGWQSDRGRIRIMYGEPDEVERNPSNQETYPYEIWQFDKLQGGVIFVFVDTMGMNDFQLVHSTHRNELQNENWMEEYARKPFNH